MWRSRRREVLLCGPANTGKSRANIEKLHYCADKYAGIRCLMVRKTRKSLTQSAMVTYEQKVLPAGWLGHLIHFRTQEQQYEYPNGSIIAVAGMDDADKVQSSEWDLIYPQEATELTINDWEILTKCLRNKQMPYQQLLADCNPSYPTHWLKQRCDRGATLLLESRHEDNPSITPEDIATLDALTGVRKLRLRKGIWAAAEGMVYEEWDSAIHKVSKRQLVKWGILTAEGKPGSAVKQVYASVDWGYTNPGVISVWAIDGDARMYLICEVYMTRQTDDWWVARAKLLLREYGVRAWICDPAEPAYIAKFRDNGLNAREASNAIAPGINRVQARLKLAGDGRPRLFVYEYALQERDESLVKAYLPFCSEGEVLEYVWPKAQDGKSLKEVPVDANNHAMDTWRYMAMHLDSGPSAQKHIDHAREYQELVRKQNAA
jgi:PBSX family phage terminase large subunit